MRHLPTFKEKVKQYPKQATMALLNYPILMAADILIYKSTHVPVGIDQEPHLEISREIARKMNDKYGTSFPEPIRFKTEGEYVPSLTGQGKMSKSIIGSFINLTDNLEEIKNKVAKIPTDSGKGEEIPTVGGVSGLLKMIELFEGKEKKEEYEKSYVGEGLKYGEIKQELAEVIYGELAPIQEKRREIMNKNSYLEEVMEDGRKRASIVAEDTLEEVREKMGLR